MYSFLKRPAWLALGLVAVLLSGLFIRLGFWQLGRLEERRLDNAIIAARLSGDPVPLETAVDLDATLDAAAAEHEFRRVRIEGEYVTADEVLIRSQTHRGQAGFHVLTPFMLGDGLAVLVNRGWVPLGEDSPPVSQTPPEARVTLEVVIQGTQTRGPVGPVDEPGIRLTILSRVDIERIEQQLDYGLVPVYGLLVDGTGELPIPVELPELNEGTHLSYSIQWFAFALISIGGFAALARTTAKRTRRKSSSEDGATIS